jgi:hypothetical protein
MIIFSRHGSSEEKEERRRSTNFSVFAAFLDVADVDRTRQLPDMLHVVHLLDGESGSPRFVDASSLLQR